MNPDGKCRTCGDPIRWVIVAATGSRMPMNPSAIATGNVWVERWDDGIPRVAIASKDNPVPAHAVLLYTSHFATCKDAALHRRK